MKVDKRDITRYIILLILRCPVDALLTVIQATFLKQAFDAIELGDNSSLVQACVIFLVASICLFSYNSVVWMVFAANTIRMAGILRRKLMKTLLSRELPYMEEHSQGDILTRMNTDTNMAVDLFGGALTIPHFILAIVRITVSAIFLYTIDTEILVVVLACLVPHVLINAFVVARPMKKLKSNVSKATAQASGMLGSMITSADTTILYDAQDFILSKYEEASLKIYKENMKIVRRNVLGATIMPIFGAGGYLIVIMMGIGSIAGNEMNFGDLTSALQYRGGIITGSMMLINCIISIYTNMAGWERVKNFLHTEHIERSIMVVRSTKGTEKK